MFHLKQAAALLIIISLLTQMFSRPLVYVSYMLNRASFEQHCENKNRPERHCFGRCQIVKRVQQEEEKEQQNPLQKDHLYPEWIANRNEFYGAGFTPQFIVSVIHTPAKEQPGTVLTGFSDIFHPPKKLMV